MLAYIIRRLLVAVPILVVSTFLVFLMVSLSGDPLSSYKFRNPPLPASTIHNLEHELHLDQPLLQRYGTWIEGIVVHGNFGPSLNYTNIRSVLFDRAVVTLRMVIVAIFLALIFAVIVGVVSAVRQYSGLDYAFTFTGFLFLSMPVFWLAVLLKEFLAVDLNRWFGHTFIYTIGAESIDYHGSTIGKIGDIAGHMALPTIVLAMTSFAAWSRFQRASMLDVLNSDYIRLARAKGLSKRRVMIRHALRTALIPLATVVAIDFAGILSGAIITETVFQWQGLGQLLLGAIQARDVYVVLAWLLFSAFLVIVANLIADLLYAVLDPRIRYA